MPHFTQKMVLDFHKKMGLSIGDPTKPDFNTDKELRFRLIEEEFEELRDALFNFPAEDSLIRVADALADLQYVINGAASSWGIDLAGVFEEVHKSNMTKSPGNLRPDGKILKGPEYVPPDIKLALATAKQDFEIVGPTEDWWPEPTSWDKTTEIQPEYLVKWDEKESQYLATCKQFPGFSWYADNADEALRGLKSMIRDAISDEDPPDFLDEMIKERTQKNPDFPGLVDEAIKNRQKPVEIEEAIEEIENQEISDGIPARIMGEFTRYGAYIFDCPCGRRHAVESKLGTRGGLAPMATCECICGNAFQIEFHKGLDATIRVTTIEELRKADVR